MKRFLREVVIGIVRLILGIFARVEVRGLEHVPSNGPLLLITNHINFFDAIVIMGVLHPRPLTMMGKAENFQKPLLKAIFSLWDAIPVRRGELDMTAIHDSLEALRQGKMLGVAPEGTRSKNGVLQQGRAGMVLLAHRSGAPFLPVAIFGHEHYRDDVRHFHKVRVHANFGQMFQMETGGAMLSRDVREEITDEIMYRIAALLPEAQRGVYADFQRAGTRYLRFPPPGDSNPSHI